MASARSVVTSDEWAETQEAEDGWTRFHMDEQERKEKNHAEMKAGLRKNIAKKTPGRGILSWDQLDESKETGPDPADPRTQGYGWCAKSMHVAVDFSCNQYGAWQDCLICGLRLIYIPRKGYHGKYRRQQSTPEEITRAFRIAERRAEQHYTANRFKAYLEMAKGEMKLENPRFCRTKPGAREPGSMAGWTVPRASRPDSAAPAAGQHGGDRPQPAPEDARDMTDATKRPLSDTPW